MYHFSILLKVITIFYNLFIAVYGFAIKLASLWNPKAKLWNKGRKHFFRRLEKQLKVLPNDNFPIVWMHCASLGEFEQGRPVLEAIRTSYPKSKVVLTFFSPSGFEIMKNYKGADLILYLPLDTISNARQLVQMINPTLVLWVRYEFWMYYLKELKSRKVPLLLLSGTIKKGNNFYNLYRKELFACFTHFFVQSASSALYLKKEGFEQNVSPAGDTRFDRVLEIAKSQEPIAPIEAFCSGHTTIIAGSTWPEDEEEWTHFVRNHSALRFIIAPHEVDKENIRDVQKRFPDSILFSEWQNYFKDPDIVPANPQEGIPAHVNTLIINNIGMLSRLYRYADITYVGGGFGETGLHNILEAAVYGKPVFFGPVYHQNFEAIDMIEAGGAISIENAIELETELNILLQDREILRKRGQAASQFVCDNAGATKIIMEYIQRNRLLTN